MITINIGRGRPPKARKKPPAPTPKKDEAVKISDMHFRAMLQEYSELRKELGSHLQMQNTVIGLIATTIGVLVTIALNMHSKPIGERPSEAVFIIFCTIIPGIVAFLSMLWLWQVHRSKKMGVYLSLLEKKINTAVGAENSMKGSALYWENWSRQQASNKDFFARISSYQYYMCMGMFLVVPIISFLVGLLLAETNPFSAWVALFVMKMNTPCFVMVPSFELIIASISALVGIVFYILFWFFFGRYRKEFRELDAIGFDSIK